MASSRKASVELPKLAGDYEEDARYIYPEREAALVFEIERLRKSMRAAAQVCRNAIAMDSLGPIQALALALDQDADPRLDRASHSTGEGS